MRELVGNKILDRLPSPDFQRVVGRMERVHREVGEVVASPGIEPRWVHFPLTGVLSSMVVLEDGGTVEASTVGNEGMDGLYLLLIRWPTHTRSMCRLRGICCGCRRRRFDRRD